MFLFFSLLASSIDGFICGLALGSAGFKITLSDGAVCFVTIFCCCFSAAAFGGIMTAGAVAAYLDIAGALIMTALAIGAVRNRFDNSRHKARTVGAVGLSLAADASIVCVYLGISGFNCAAVAFISAAMHCILISTGCLLAGKIHPKKNGAGLKYLAGAIFSVMAAYKLLRAVEDFLAR